MLWLAGAAALAAIGWSLVAGDEPARQHTTAVAESPTAAAAPATKAAVTSPAAPADTSLDAPRDAAGAPPQTAAASIAAEIEAFDRWQSPAATAARRRIAARGRAALPDVVAALRAAGDAAAAIDLTDPGRDRAAAEAALMRHNHLLATVAQIGGEEAVGAILDRAGRMSPDSPLRGTG